MSLTPLKVVKGFIINTDKGETIHFQFNPNDMEVVDEAIYDDQDNRNLVPYQEWTGSKRNINFTLQFSKRPGYYMSATVDWLQDLTKPKMKNGKVTPPPTCLIHVGSAEFEVKVRKVTRNYTQWLPDGPASEIDVTLECSEYKKVPKPPEKASTAAAKKPKEPEETPYAYLATEQSAAYGRLAGKGE